MLLSLSEIPMTLELVVSRIAALTLIAARARQAMLAGLSLSVNDFSFLTEDQEVYAHALWTLHKDAMMTMESVIGTSG